jgi:hypothetical protein
MLTAKDTGLAERCTYYGAAGRFEGLVMTRMDFRSRAFAGRGRQDGFPFGDGAALSSVGHLNRRAGEGGGSGNRVADYARLVGEEAPLTAGARNAREGDAGIAVDRTTDCGSGRIGEVVAILRGGSSAGTGQNVINQARGSSGCRGTRRSAAQTGQCGAIASVRIIGAVGRFCRGDGPHRTDCGGLVRSHLRVQ